MLARWAAISTIWIVIPIMIVSLIFLALLAGIIYLFARLLGITPIYTNRRRILFISLPSASGVPLMPRQTRHLFEWDWRKYQDILRKEITLLFGRFEQWLEQGERK